MYPVLFRIDGYAFRTYTLFVLIGIILGYIVFVKMLEYRKIKISKDRLSDILTWAVIGGVVGARVYYVILHWDVYYKENIAEIFKVWHGGLVFFGGFLGALFFNLIYAKIRKFSLRKIFDAVGVAFPLGYFFGKLGCFFNGCCFGKPTTCFIGIKFPKNSLVWKTLSETLEFQKSGGKVFPAQLIESFGYLIVFLIVFFLYRKRDMNWNGRLFFVALGGVALWRFLVDFIRWYEPYVYIGPLPHSSVLALILIIVSIYYYVRFSKFSN